MSANITASAVKDLRTQTGAAMMECKSALTEAGGDIEKAKEILRARGVKSADKKADRSTSEGIVASYMHHNSRVGVLLEVNCETDFVARTDDFLQSCKDIAMHIAAMSPTWVSREEVPEEMKNKELELIRSESEEQMAGKPEQVVEKILEGRLNKFFAERCLLEQPFCKDDSKTVQQFLKELIARLGENIVLKRFARIEVGG